MNITKQNPPHPIISSRFYVLAAVALLAIAAPQALAADDAWITDFAVAKATAAESGRDLLLAFTDFDWCPLSQRLQKELFLQDAFLTAASGHFVLVKLDYPIRDYPVDPSIEKTYEQNDALAWKYRIDWLPTIILADADGRPYAFAGLGAEDPAKYAAHLNALKERRASRDAAFTSAVKAAGLEKAKQLAGAIDATGLDFGVIKRFYGDILAEIAANDPADETGFARRAALQDRLDAIHVQMNALAGDGNFAGIHPLIDDLLAIQGLSRQQKQKFTFYRAKVFQMLNQIDNAVNAADEATRIDPASEMIPILANFKIELAARAVPKPCQRREPQLRRKPQWRPLPHHERP